MNALLPALHQLADRHVGCGNKPGDNTLLGKTLLITLQQGLGTEFTPELRQAWVDVFLNHERA